MHDAGEALVTDLHHNFDLFFTCVGEIPRQAKGKYEDFQFDIG